MKALVGGRKLDRKKKGRIGGLELSIGGSFASGLNFDLNIPKFSIGTPVIKTNSTKCSYKINRKEGKKGRGDLYTSALEATKPHLVVLPALLRQPL